MSTVPMSFSKARIARNGLQPKLMTLSLAPSIYHIHADYIDEKSIFVYDCLSQGIFPAIPLDTDS